MPAINYINTLVFPNIPKSTETVPTQWSEGNRISFSTEKYGCFENFESSKYFAYYLEQIKNDFDAIAKSIGFHEPFGESLNMFCAQISHHQLIDSTLKKFLYTDLDEFLYSISQLNINNLPDEKLFIRDMLNDAFLSLGKNDFWMMLSNIKNAFVVMNSPSEKSVSKQVDNKIDEVMNAVLTEFVKLHHADGAENQTARYIDAYKQYLKEAKWKYALQFEDKNVGVDIESITKNKFLTLYNQIIQKTEIVSIIKSIGDSIRQKIEEIFNKPGNYTDIKDMRYLSSRGHEEVLQFTRSTNLPVDLNAILGRNLANNGYIYLLEYSDAIYGDLFEFFVAENRGYSYCIKREPKGARNTVETFKSFSWVNRGNYKEPVAQVPLSMGKIDNAISNKRVRSVIVVPQGKKSEKNICSVLNKNNNSICDGLTNNSIYKLAIDNVEIGMVDVDSKDKNGNTLLHIIAYHCDTEAYEKLKDKLYVYTNSKNKFNVTPLMLAAAKNFGSMVVDLVIRGNIDLNATDRHGKTALDMAIINKHDTIVQILKSCEITNNSLNRKRANKDNGLAGNDNAKKILPKYRKYQQ
ncbi:ankyrin repeat domain-containing protein [Sodalis sp. dw_96]|uniref:ankyrin repeat domain-containing protein n=1 Tax=Sodalis sp. dw_96 TaxID=2719794 RepID=UPI001BD440D8|nr:ankyrin repeat domain-containing protein [Sodalis sp. dw_96]